MPIPQVQHLCDQSIEQSSVQTVGNYLVTNKTIETGTSIGETKLAIHIATQQKFAIKILPRPSCSDSSGTTPQAFSIQGSNTTSTSLETRVVRDAALSALLHHPHLCRMYELLVDRQHYYLVFEYVAGDQLLDYIIRHGRFLESIARRFAHQIGSALDYCHSNNVVHRNLLLENILISHSGDIKITDFGLANLYDSVGQLSTYCGSGYFASPEMLNGRPYVGPEVDVWNFGVILYVLVCGRVPFDDVSIPALHDKIKRGSVTYPCWLSKGCTHLLSRMLTVDPEDRASVAEVLTHPWMLRGSNVPRPPANLDHRKAILQAVTCDDLDPDVIRYMRALGFGSEADIVQRLTAVLASDEYRLHNSDTPLPRSSKISGKLSMFSSVVSSWRRRTMATTAADASSSRDPRSHARPSADLTRRCHPLVSMYRLARDKRERDAAGLGETTGTDADVLDPEEPSKIHNRNPFLHSAARIHAFMRPSRIRRALVQRWRLFFDRSSSTNTRDVDAKGLKDDHV